MPKQAHVFQHVPFEGLGAIEPWLRERGWAIASTCFFAGDMPPAPGEMDFLIVMGGPMSANDGTKHPWLAEEQRVIAEAIKTGIPVLGVCLGAQLIARALGARVSPQAEKEIGWLPVQGVAVGARCFSFPHQVTVFHWHGETFDLPPGAHLLARSNACAHQAFQVGERVIGLQFHLEITPASARALCTHCREELVPGPFIQTEQMILNASEEVYAVNHALLDALLCWLVNGLFD